MSNASSTDPQPALLVFYSFLRPSISVSLSLCLSVSLSLSLSLCLSLSKLSLSFKVPLFHQPDIVLSYFINFLILYFVDLLVAAAGVRHLARAKKAEAMELVRLASPPEHGFKNITCFKHNHNVAGASGACNQEGIFRYRHRVLGDSYFQIHRIVASNPRVGRVERTPMQLGWKQFQFVPCGGEVIFIVFLHINSKRVFMSKLTVFFT